MRDCPQCGRRVDGLSCVCGWGEDAGKKRDDQRVDVNYGGGLVIKAPRCAGYDDGHRCASPGTISAGSGPCFCWRHAKPILQTKGSPPPGGFDALRNLVAPRRLDVEAELERAAMRDESSE